MADSILRFPGFIVAEDRNTILKDGKRYKSIKAPKFVRPGIVRRQLSRHRGGRASS